MKNNRFISSIWNFNGFSKEELNGSNHDIFRWYGKLVPELVRRLITMYSDRNDLILANFAGSGTVLVEANHVERSSIGVDSNPLSYLICKVRTTPFVPDYEVFVKEVDDLLRKNKSEEPSPSRWFSNKTYNDLKLLSEKINKIDDERVRNFYLLAIASIIRKISKIDDRCINHIVFDKKKKSCDVLSEFKTKLKLMRSEMNNFSNKYNNVKTEIRMGDARNLEFLDDNSVDLVISHPPYLGAINYPNINKLSTDILGFRYEKIREKDISTTSLNKYMGSMKQVFDEMYRVLKNNKYACVIIGDTRKNGEVIPTFSYFINHALNLGFKLEDIFIWILNQKAGMNVKRHGNHIDHNYILVFKKIGG